MEYDNYYEEDLGDEVVVHLDYLEPEPSLFQQSSRYDRPMLRREYTPVVRTSKQRLSRPNTANYNHNHNHNQNHNSYNNGRGGFNRLQDDDDDYRDDDDDDDDGDMYDRMTERVNIQEQRYGAESNRTMGSGSTRSGNESRGRMDTGGGGAHMKMRNNNNNMHNNMHNMGGAGPGPIIVTGRAKPGSNRGSGRSVVSRLSTSSHQKKGKSKMDLTRPDADSSFELFATLLIQHLDPKINDDMNMYILEAGDMAYFEAIMPETLRNPFVEAVRVRSRRLTEEPVDGESESDLDKITRKCAAFGLGQSAENNFLLGGGQKKGGKTIIRLVEEESFEDQQSADQNGISEAEALAQIEAAFNNRPHNMVMQPQPNINNTPVDGGDQEEEISSKRQFGAQIGGAGAGAGVDYNNLQQKEQEVPSKHQVQIELAEMRNPPATGTAQRGTNSSGSEKGTVLHEEKVFNDVVENDAPAQQAVFDLTVKREEEKKAQAREKRMKKSSRKMSNLTAAISVNTSPSNLDMTVAAFEHEWRDGLWDIYTHGVCHPLLFLSFGAPIFALGQVMTRLKLNWIGVPSNEAGTNAVFRKLGTLVTIWATVNIGAVSSYVYAFVYIKPYLELVVMAVVMTNLWFYSFCVFVTGNTRQYLREIYNIQDGAGSDYLLAAIYMPFSIAQMGRHTADYNSLQGRLCTDTGLAREADYSFISNINTMDSFGTYRSFNDDGTSFGGSVYTRKSTKSHKSAKSRRSKRSNKSRMLSVDEDNEDDNTSFSGTSYTGSAASLV